VLLVRANFGPLNGQWVLPGGLVKAGETILEAVVREVREESGVEMSPESAMALRHYVEGERNNLLTVILGRWLAGEPRPDGRETNAAAFFDPAEALGLDNLYPVGRLAITLALRNPSGLSVHPGANPHFQFLLPAGVELPPGLVPDRP
jgi:ADP-ribose pyrophosphatase YjhB (NUDIX family)